MKDKTERIAKTYRLTASTVQMIGEICESENVSATKAVELAIAAYCLEDCETQSESNNSAEDGSTNAIAIDVLREQLAIKDGQIAVLTDKLSEALNRSQTLQGLALQKKSLPQRVRAWLMGDRNE